MQLQFYGSVPLDFGCTRAILNKEFVRRGQIPLKKQDTPLEMIYAQGDLTIGAGEYFNLTLHMVIGQHEETIH